MEVVFKNRPYPDIEINETEDGASLEFVRSIKVGSEVRTPRLVINKKSLPAFAEWLKFAMHSYSTKKTETPHDSFEGKLTGSDYREEDEIAIHSKHTQKDGTIINTGIAIPQNAGESLLNAVERWIQSPTL